MYGNYTRYLREHTRAIFEERQALRRIEFHHKHAEEAGIDCPQLHLPGRTGWKCEHCGFEARKDD